MLVCMNVYMHLDCFVAVLKKHSRVSRFTSWGASCKLLSSLRMVTWDSLGQLWGMMRQTWLNLGRGLWKTYFAINAPTKPPAIGSKIGNPTMASEIPTMATCKNVQLCNVQMHIKSQLAKSSFFTSAVCVWVRVSARQYQKCVRVCMCAGWHTHRSVQFRMNFFSLNFVRSRFFDLFIPMTKVSLIDDAMHSRQLSGCEPSCLRVCVFCDCASRERVRKR